MLTEAQVRTAVANGIKFVNRTREPYGLWFMSMMHRLFGDPGVRGCAQSATTRSTAERPHQRRRCCACFAASTTPTTRFSLMTGTTC